MIVRLAWLVINPMASGDFSKLVRAVERDQFTPEATTGFIIDSSRRSSLEARFIQRRILKETVSDPFGNESTIERTEYTQTQFRLFTSPPHLEVVNPPRSLNHLVNRLGELTQGKAAIHIPEIPVGDWMIAASQKARSAKVTGLLISNLQLTQNANAKVLVKGSDDIQKLLPSIVGRKKHSIKEALLELETSDGFSLRVTIKENCRATIQAKNEEVFPFLRSLLPTLLPNG